MKYKTVNDFKEESHPWPPYIPVSATKLILGPFPTSERNRGAYEFFYPNPVNNFWKILFAIAEKDYEEHYAPEPVSVRKQVLSDLNLGIADIGKKILRQNNSSNDQNLFPIEFTDVFGLLDNHPDILKIIITSSTGANSVLSWFQQYCRLNGIILNAKSNNLPIDTSIILNNRIIHIGIISSPSSQSPIRGERLFRMYRDSILENPESL